MRFLFFITAIFVSANFAHAADRLSPTVPDKAKTVLDRGEPYVDVWRDETREDGAMDVLGIIDIMAPPALIWDVMTDCNRAREIVDNMTSCEVIDKADDGSWDIRKQKVRVNFLMSSTSVFRSDYDPLHSIKISRAGGDMKVQDGLWTLTPMGKSQTRVTYRAASAPKFPVPKSSLRKAMKDDVPEILNNLRQASENDLKALQTVTPAN